MNLISKIFNFKKKSFDFFFHQTKNNYERSQTGINLKSDILANSIYENLIKDQITQCSKQGYGYINLPVGLISEGWSDDYYINALTVDKIIKRLSDIGFLACGIRKEYEVNNKVLGYIKISWQ